ncbi:MAG: hypothetical protein DIZ80_14460 [endosymbiont of Galathealinum brachiosum]|uniref:DUF3108 domain-containing protein n=1 Tax=endosymbiont of Galathealinum brachiosum TaxID=2200906 RepID=A0A370D8S5_9GAMM|nr:MAG: hypothetical protein DIZ80_14460 [endosymbiont of Galathealinum brachiosum]
MDKQPTHQLNLDKSAIVYLLLLSALLSLFTSKAIAENSPVKSDTYLTETLEETSFILPPNHQSLYSMEKYGSHVGEMKNKLHYKDGTINYTSSAEAKGLASLFIKAEPKETSILNWPENKQSSLPQQLSFSYIQGKKHKKNQQIMFEHVETGETQITGSYKFKPYSLQSTQTVWGRQLLPLLMSSDLQLDPHTTSNSFYITDKGHLQKYTYTLVTSEDIKFKNKIQPVLKFKLSREGSRRMSYVWLSRDHYYLPLKIEQYKDGDLNVRMLMTHLNLD